MIQNLLSSSEKCVNKIKSAKLIEQKGIRMPGRN